MRAAACAFAALAFAGGASAQSVAGDTPDPSASIETETLHDLAIRRGCSDVVVTDPTGSGLVVAVYRHDGERLVEPRRGVGRVVLRVCTGRDDQVVVHARSDRPTLVSIAATSVRDGSPIGDEAGEGRERRTTGVPFVASASARVAAAIDRFVSEGLPSRDPVSVQIVRDRSEIAIPVRSGPGCLFLVVAAEGGDVDVAGTAVRDGHRAELLACADAGSTIAIRALAGTPRLAHAFVGASIDPSQPLRSRQLAWATTRGFTLVRELDLVLDPGEGGAMPLSVGASRCVAVLVASASPASLTVEREDGTLLGISSATSPGPGIVRCSESTPLALRVTVRSMSEHDRVRLLVVESPSP